MRLLNKSIFALSFAAMMGLWSCASEEVLPVDQPTAGDPIILTITVDRGNATTRTLLSDDGNGGLTSVWKWKDKNKSDGKDKILLVDTRGNVQAHLYLVDGEGTSKGVFEGTFSNYQEDQVYNLWYCMHDSWFVGSGTTGDCGFTIQTGKQAYFSLEELSAKEIMSSNQTNARGGYKIEVKNGRAYIMEDVKLESRLAMARFSMDALPAGVKGTLYIYNADGNGRTPVEIKFLGGVKFSPEGTISYKTTKGGVTYDKITIENAEAGKDVYVALIPGAYRLGFQFIAEDGTEYTYEREKSTDLNYGVYYTDGNGGAIPVSFTEVKKEIDYKVILNNEDGTLFKTIEESSTEDPHTISLPEGPEKYDHVFLGWSTDKQGEPKREWTLTEKDNEVTLVPIYDQNKHDLQVFAYNNDGTGRYSIDTNHSKTLPYTADLENLDTPVREGYEFMGWGKTATATATEAVESVTFETPDPISVYAIWKKKDSSGTITAPGSEGSDY